MESKIKTIQTNSIETAKKPIAMILIFALVFVIGVGAIIYHHFCIRMVGDNRMVRGADFEGVVLINDADATWVPNDQAIRELEAGLEKYLDGLNEKDGYYGISIVKKDLKKYKRQYIGQTIDGQKVIWSNCLIYFKNDPFGSDWKNELIIVRDGGSDYFQIYYDVESKSYFDFYVNGTA